MDKTDLLGNTALHHAARHGQWNCVSFLVNFGANIYKMDNDFHTALNVAAIENRTEIVKILDMAQNEQENKNPKVVRSLKEKALKDAEKNIAHYEKLLEKTSKEMEKQKKLESQMNGDFKAPTSKSLVSKLTWKRKGNTAKLKAGNTFSSLAGTTTRNRLHRDTSNEFTVTELDESGNRTHKSVRGTVSRSGGQVMYINTVDIDIDGKDQSNDPGARPALSNVFPGASNNFDSGIDSFEDAEEAPGLFNRPTIGKLSFFKTHFDHMASIKNNEGDENGLENGWTAHNGVDTDENDSNKNSNGSLGASADTPEDQGDEEDPLDDDDDDNEYTPVIVFLESCGLHHYAHLFLNGEVDMDALMMLTNQDFGDMGIPIGPRRKLMDAIQRRRVVLTEPAQMYDTQL